MSNASFCIALRENDHHFNELSFQCADVDIARQDYKHRFASRLSESRPLFHVMGKHFNMPSGYISARHPRRRGAKAFIIAGYWRRPLPNEKCDGRYKETGLNEAQLR